MNQDTNTQGRGVVVGAASVAAAIWPQYANLIMPGAGLLYTLLAFTKPWWPVKKAPGAL